jgi:hypothetical protein
MSGSAHDTAPSSRAVAHATAVRPHGGGRPAGAGSSSGDRLAWVGELLTRPWVLRATLVAFVLLGVVFAVVLHYPVVDGNGNVPYAGTIAPDEHRHIANILFYAQRSVAAGPIIDSVPTRDLAMGEVLRFPSYAYYYVMSFPVKLMLHESVPYGWVVVSLRLVNVVFGALGLVAVRRLVEAIGFSAPTAVLTTVLLAFTGRYVWQSAAVSYDAPATTLFLVCLLLTVRYVRDPASAALGGAVVAGAWAIITKYTFLPFVVVAIVLAIVLVAQRDGLRRALDPRRAASDLATDLRRRTVRTTARLVAFVVAAVVLVERYGINLVRYRQVNPDCDKLHTHQQCLTFDIYARNYAFERVHDLDIVTGKSQPSVDALEFVGRWCTTYLQSIFFYRDRNSAWVLDPGVALLGTVVFVAACLALLLTLRKLLRSRAVVWAFAVAAVYVVAMFVFNVRTVLQLDQELAFSGRYLVPVLPIVYAFALAAGLVAWRSLPDGLRRVAVVPLAVVVLVVLVLYSAPVAFFANARDPSWYTDVALRVLPGWLTGSSGGGA